MVEKSTKIGRWAAMAILVLAGEVIFFLPFVLPRVFKPTLLAVFDISNLELGYYFSIYGIVALGAYLLGGPLADRFAPHGLMATALLATGLGGLYLYTLPSTAGMAWLYGFWGLTTILLFWAAMLRATRVLGGPGQQGLAFGFLDGGRGLVAALMASLGVTLLAGVLPNLQDDVVKGGSAALDPAIQREGLRLVIAGFTALVLATAAGVWWGLRGLDQVSKASTLERIDWRLVGSVARRPKLWLNALVVLCAYSGYRVLDDVSLLARDGLGYDEVEAARLGSWSLYLRAVAAIGAGLLADRWSASVVSLLAFTIMLMGGLWVALGAAGEWALVAIWAGVVLTGLGVYGLRGIYFALVAEGGTPLLLTGTAIGLTSVVGYLPDIYMAPLMGWLLDSYPGELGHRLVFGLAAVFASLGLMAAGGFWKLGRSHV